MNNGHAKRGQDVLVVENHFIRYYFFDVFYEYLEFGKVFLRNIQLRNKAQNSSKGLFMFQKIQNANFLSYYQLILASPYAP